MPSVVNVRRGLALLVALAALAGAIGPASAATSSATSTPPAASSGTSPEARQREIDAELKRLRGELAALDSKQARAVAELRVTQRHRQQLDAELAGIDRELSGAQGELDALANQLEGAIAAQLQAQQAVEAAEADLKEATAVLHEQAVQAFIRFGAKKSVNDLLAEIQDVNDAPRVAAWVDAVAARQAEVVREHRRLQRGTTELRAVAEAARIDVGRRRDEAATRKAEIERARGERALAQAAVAQELANEQRLLDSLKATRSKAAAELAELERASAAVKALLQRRQAGQAVIPVRPGFLQAPLLRPALTSSYGWRVHPIFGDSRLHAGVDFAAEVGTAVFAAGDGTVLYAGWQSGYGNTVIVDHGGSIATLYAHNSALAVAEGTKVKRGQRIASAGSTGNSTGPHVHFEVRVNGSTVDPLGYL